LVRWFVGSLVRWFAGSFVRLFVCEVVIFSSRPVLQDVVDSLQVGLSGSSERVWKWTFSATKSCGFGVKSTPDVVKAVRGRYALTCSRACVPPPAYGDHLVYVPVCRVSLPLQLVDVRG
jgi:hypothetical protein